MEISKFRITQITSHIIDYLLFDNNVTITYILNYISEFYIFTCYWSLWFSLYDIYMMIILVDLEALWKMYVISFL